MRTRAGAVAAILALVAVVAVVNSHRVHHAPRALPVPAPSPTPTLIATQLAGCPTTAIQTVDTEFSATAVDSENGVSIVAESVRCDTGQGVRGPSQVQIAGLRNRVVAVLINQSRDVHYYSLDAQGSMTSVSGVQTGATVTVTYTDWAPGHALGVMYAEAFTTTDGSTFHAGPENRVAPACGSAALRLSAATGANPDATVLRVANISDDPCALEGYPIVSGADAMHFTVSARSELHGASGGVTVDNAPPVILLDPGQAANAALDSSDQAPDGGATLCESLTSVTVGLASGADLGSVPVKIRVCDFQTHPWVPGLTGSHP